MLTSQNLLACRLLGLLLPLLGAFAPLSRADVVYPPTAGVINVRESPYHAKGDGISDDTEALQQALWENGHTNRIIYLPEGIYRISGALRWSAVSGTPLQGRTILQGQGRGKTIIRLLDYSPHFADSGKPKPMIATGEGSRFLRNAVRDLTLDTGIGNPGASGLQLLAHHQGGVRNVDIVAGGDGAGGVGLDLGVGEDIGPLLVKNLRVHGFETGIRTGKPAHSVTLEDIQLTGQRTEGIRNGAQVVTIRRLRSTNTVTALQNTDESGFVTLVDSVLQGLPAKRTSSAVVNRGFLVMRDVAGPGYTNLLQNWSSKLPTVKGSVVDEYQSHGMVNLFPSPPVTMRLPVEETPETPWDPVSDWASPAQFGGRGGDAEDDSGAIQKAIDSGATTVFLPNGTWNVRHPVEIRGKVRRIVGTEAVLNVIAAPGQSAFRIGQESAPTVWLEQMEVTGSRAVFLRSVADRRVVIRDCSGVSVDWKGKGTLFLENVSSDHSWTFEKGQNIWARQWFARFTGDKIINRGGTVWILGLSTERPGTLVDTLDGGRSEILGGLCASTGTWKSMPMFRIQDASACFVMAEMSPQTAPYQTIVEERRAERSRRLPNTGAAGGDPLPTRTGGIALTLYSGYSGPGSVAPKGSVPTVAEPAKTSP
jgi:hypothetical protein